MREFLGYGSFANGWDLVCIFGPLTGGTYRPGIPPLLKFIRRSGGALFRKKIELPTSMTLLVSLLGFLTLTTTAR